MTTLLERDMKNAKWLGVCSGITNFLELEDPIFVRMFFVVMAVGTGFLPALIIYLLFAWLMPKGE